MHFSLLKIFDNCFLFSVSKDAHNIRTSFTSVFSHNSRWQGGKYRSKNIMGAAVLWLWLVRTGNIFHLQSQIEKPLKQK